VYWLGVKNALGPEIVDDVGLRGFVNEFFSGYHDDPLEAPLELAREVAFGSLEYARGLGFDPHPDSAPAHGHLGTGSGPSAITFGKNGKPLYISEPTTIPALSSALWNAPSARGTSTSWRLPGKASVQSGEPTAIAEGCALPTPGWPGKQTADDHAPCPAKVITVEAVVGTTHVGALGEASGFRQESPTVCVRAGGRTVRRDQGGVVP
jgi:hypothetical protein